MDFDIAVIGGGHAGIEAASASSRMGLRVALVTLSAESVGRMSCNPAIGGIAKGQLVREVDALGGVMGLAADSTGIHFRMLNRSKGPAMHSPRCQSDKDEYGRFTLAAVRASGCAVIEAEAAGLHFEGSRLAGVRLAGGEVVAAARVVLAAGTFLNGLIHRGKETFAAGRIGEPASIALSRDLARLGLRPARLKTGTPARVKKSSLDYGKMQLQLPDKEPQPFSFRTARLERPALPCHQTWTTPETHRIIRDNLDAIPLYNGQITGIGPRYCPSIEGKVKLFPDRERHQVFVEPEGLSCEDVYLNGVSSSMDSSLQDRMLRTIPGLERAEVLRYGYAIEYDFFPPDQISPDLQSRIIPGLFPAGQVNGTTGYEEAAAQGLLAGINAALSVRGEAPLVLGREEAYLGVLVDDLVTKEITEPYRMFTSRAEHRLMLRHDNADLRLMPHGRRLGLVPQADYDSMRRRYDLVQRLAGELEGRYFEGISLATRLRNPANTIEDVCGLPSSPPELLELGRPEKASLETQVKYGGYLAREARRVERMRRLEEEKLPRNIDYLKIVEMRLEARQKLALCRPDNLGRASRISGVNPSDVQILELHLRRRRWPLLA